MEALKQFEKDLILRMLDRPDMRDFGHTVDDLAKLQPLKPSKPHFPCFRFFWF